MTRKTILLFALVAAVATFPLAASAQSDSVPAWIKNTAGWWADDQISETEFVNSMEYLIDSGTIDVSSDEIRQSLKDPINLIVEAVKHALERTPPELSADILDRGIILTGGGSMLKGIDQLIRERTNVPVNIGEEPLLSVVKGTGKVLEDVKKYEAVLI